MESQFRGLYVHRLSNGKIIAVQVVGEGDLCIPMNLSSYKERGCMPPVETLPDKKDYIPGKKTKSA